MHSFAEIALNLSFVLYLIFYLPQLFHNVRHKRIHDMSFAFHALLFIAATADLYYGFGRIQQWQYRAVSIVMFLCLCVQHIQWYKYAEENRWGSPKFWTLTAVILLMVIGVFLVKTEFIAAPIVFIIAGWIERIGYWLYALPQIIKNVKLHSGRAISPIFLSIGLITGICNTISAWSFNWGSPSLYGAPIAIAMHLWLLWQCFSLQKRKHKLLILLD